MRKLHLTLLPALLLALALGLAACGGGGESDEDKVVETIETSALSADPADCKELATIGFLEQTQLEKGDAAVESCEEDAKDGENDPDSVKVTKVKVDGSDATADAAFEGGTFDGQTLSVALVEEDGTWKMDEITKFAKLDQEQLATAFEEALTSGEDALPEDVGTCFGEVIRELPAEEVEEVIIGGDPQPLVELLEGCQEGLQQ
ncbi:MAG TPA: hypothetical protein VGW80_10810 [Solirubrobacterales bacterium]|nr:hypothetical protein [Solirubrobacterales bacterium]